MTADVAVALLVNQKVRAIAADEDLNEQAKLFAFLLITDIAVGKGTLPASAKLQRRRGTWITRIDTQAGWPGFCRTVIRSDVPRYLGERPEGCVAEMVRRDGICGRSVYERARHLNPLTGEWTDNGYCTRHWSLTHRDEYKRQYREWNDNDKPVPKANHGGVLRRHFYGPWDEIYAWADPHLAPLEGGKPPTLPRPTLTVIHGGA